MWPWNITLNLINSYINFSLRKHGTEGKGTTQHLHTFSPPKEANVPFNPLVPMKGE